MSSIVRAVLDELFADPELRRELLEEIKKDLLGDEATSPAPMIDTKTAAARLSVSEETLKRYARRGLVPGAQRVGSRWRFPADTDSIELASERSASPPAIPAPRRAPKPPAAVPASSLAASIRGR